MDASITTSEPLIRLGIFLTVLGLMAAWELKAPRRPLALRRWARWPHNLGLLLSGAIAVRLAFPAAAVGFALLAESRGWGLLPRLDLPFALTVVAAVILMDFAIWAQHLVMHHVPPLWRLHRVHHADVGFDVTTALRFHPVEILLSMALKGLVIVALGAPPLAVLIFEVLLNACAMFNHGNVRLPLWLDAALRRVLVTPDMHRVHHSWQMAETNSNYGFCLSVWDRLFRTYRAQPEGGHEGMTLGLHDFRDADEQRLDRLLLQPLRRQTRA